MKRLGRVLGNLLAVALTVVSLQAAAETQLGGRDFNHMTTGYPLLGGHAVAACETCHVGGVFKGTPRNCDGCHALGRRVVATPKSTGHIVTNDPCESCHFNTSTFLGARFNHGTAIFGQCTTCHNGRSATARPGSHTSTFKATKSCDNCHRTSSWLPATWNHTDSAMAAYSGQDCKTCHKVGGDGRTFSNVSYHNIYNSAGITMCNSCHKNYVSFYSQKYDHVGAGACQSCHTAVNSPAIKAMAANHIPILVTANCTVCHYSTAAWSAERMAHDPTQVALTPCTTCHLRGNPYLGRMRKENLHELSRNPSATDCSASGCHLPLGSKGILYQKWD